MAGVKYYMIKPSPDSVLVKSPHKRQSFTDQELTEFVDCADSVTGPAYFLDNFFHIQHPTRGKMQYHAFDYQKKLIDTYHNYRFCIAMMPRQTGKCLCPNSVISICNNVTGKTYKLPIGIFYEYQKAIATGETPPDISIFEFSTAPLPGVPE